MEADWAVEIGGETHVIDASWAGFVDLLSEPHRIAEIEEAVRFPPLGQMLLKINGREGKNQESLESSIASYAFWTVKCDLWDMENDPESWDPYEMNAEHQDVQAAIACYVDLLPRSFPNSSRLLFSQWQDAEQSARILALSMRPKELSCARADFIVRSAITEMQEGFGITAYLAACGPDKPTARVTLAEVLLTLADIVVDFPWPDFSRNAIPLQ